jgi:hypothetical protein
MAMTMLYIWAIGAIVTLLTIYIMLRVWYRPGEFTPESSTNQGSRNE